MDALNPKRSLVCTADAVIYTGRDRQTLYRWAKEGRITRHGTKGRAMWDIRELPPRPAGAEQHPPPPPRRVG